jgi:lauroyl/myristoyl acyltransferase
MSLQSLINSRLGIGFILGLGRIIPPSIGYPLADRVGKLIASRKESGMVKALRANQWIISDKTLSSEELDVRVEETYKMIARLLYDFYHTINDYDAILKRVTLCPKLMRFLESRLGGKEGTLMVAPHLSNFDLAGRAMALHGYPVQALSYPQPKGGYQWQNQLRRDIGIEITPMSTESMRQAKARLIAGGGVITGLERPLPQTNYYPHFFGYPAPLPVSYVRMALQTQSAILVIACVGVPDTDYRLECSDLIYLKPYPDAREEIERNAEKVLAQAEGFIRENPTQWAMSYPVWPFALEEMP